MNEKIKEYVPVIGMAGLKTIAGILTFDSLPNLMDEVSDHKFKKKLEQRLNLIESELENVVSLKNIFILNNYLTKIITFNSMLSDNSIRNFIQYVGKDAFDEKLVYEYLLHNLIDIQDLENVADNIVFTSGYYRLDSSSLKKNIETLLLNYNYLISVECSAVVGGVPQGPQVYALSYRGILFFETFFNNDSKKFKRISEEYEDIYNAFLTLKTCHNAESRITDDMDISRYIEYCNLILERIRFILSDMSPNDDFEQMLTSFEKEEVDFIMEVFNSVKHPYAHLYINRINV